MRKHTVLMTMGIMLVSGCTMQAPIDTDAARAALLDAATSYHEAATAKDREAVVALYADDAMMIPPNAERVDGIEGVQSYRFGFIETPGVELRFETIRAEVSSSGDLGWTLAIGDVSFVAPDGQPGRDRVRDFHTWKKQADGSWKVVIDIWNSHMPGSGSTN